MLQHQESSIIQVASMQEFSPEALQACKAADLWLVRVEDGSCVGPQLVKPAATGPHSSTSVLCALCLGSTHMCERRRMLSVCDSANAATLMLHVSLPLQITSALP